MNNDRLLRLRRLSNVPRWTVVPTIRSQNVAEHSFHVCTLALWLADRSAAVSDGRITREQLVYAALYHDEFESITGDIAAPAKKWIDNAQFDKMKTTLNIKEYENEEIKSIIKVADLMEAYLFLQEELAMGNSSLRSIMEDVVNNLYAAWLKFEYNESPKPEIVDVVTELLTCVGAYKHPCVDQV